MARYKALYRRSPEQIALSKSSLPTQHLVFIAQRGLQRSALPHATRGPYLEPRGGQFLYERTAARVLLAP